MKAFPSLPWHSLELEAVLTHLQATTQGLNRTTAEFRYGQVGANFLPQKPPLSPGQILVRQFYSPLIYILGFAAGVSLAIGDLKDAGFILAVLILNALIGGYQEWRAEQSSRALQQLLKVLAVVVRDGEVCEVDAEAVVPGDIVLLESGNRVPADLRLLHSHNLEVDESLLTGESLTVLKQASWQGEPSTPLAERLNMVYGGSIVIRGRAKGVVVETGATTAVGQVASDLLTSVGGKPPLLKRMEQFSRGVAICVLVAAVAIALLGIFQQGYSLLEMFMFTVALAVSAIP